MFLSVRALAICEINNNLAEYIFARKHFQGTYFCELGLENCKYNGRCFVNTNQKFYFHRRYFRNLRPKGSSGRRFKVN